MSPPTRYGSAVMVFRNDGVAEGTGHASVERFCSGCPYRSGGGGGAWSWLHVRPNWPFQSNGAGSGLEWRRGGNVPYATNAGPLLQAFGSRAEFRSVPGASHFSFLVPCGLPGPPFLCRDAAGFDRRAFHSEMNARVVAFFQQSL